MLEKAGFQFEGIMKNHAVKNGQVLDLTWEVNGLRFTPMIYNHGNTANTFGKVCK